MQQSLKESIGFQHSIEILVVFIRNKVWQTSNLSVKDHFSWKKLLTKLTLYLPQGNKDRAHLGKLAQVFIAKISTTVSRKMLIAPVCWAEKTRHGRMAEAGFNKATISIHYQLAMSHSPAMPQRRFARLFVIKMANKMSSTTSSKKQAILITFILIISHFNSCDF